MIRLTRTTPEPDALRVAREAELPKARAAAAAGWKGSDGRPFKFARYDAGKQTLFTDQHQKCAYCEKREEQAKHRDVEHYRPKVEYWWLAWTWENLLFACFACNRDYKKRQFPLSNGAHRLVAEAPPPGQEQPLLLDPFDPTSDPRRHIEFRRERRSGKERWIPYGLSPAGDETIRVCGLSRPSLLDLYTDHVNNFVRPRVLVFENAVEKGDVRGIRDGWSTMCRALLGPRSEFCGLSRDALAVLVPAATREQFQLVFPE